MSETNTKDLLAQLIARATDEQASPAARNRAFGEIVRRFQGMALSTARTLLGDPTAAEDAAQEAFLTLWKTLENIREPAALPRYLQRIVRTHCSRATRGKRVATVALDQASELSGGVLPERWALREELRAAVAEALEALPERERDAAERYYLDGEPQVEIAADLSLPATTIKKRLYFARQRLRERLTPIMEPANDFADAVRLFAAIDDNDIETIAALLTAQPSLRQRPDPSGALPLVRAAALGHCAALGAILETGAPDPTGAGAALCALAAGAGRIDVAERLLAAGAPIGHVDADGQTPLRRASEAALPTAEDEGDHWGLCEFLLARGASLDPVSAAALDRATEAAPGALHRAARGGWKKAVKALLESGADVNARDEEGRTALDRALQPGRRSSLPPHEAIVTLLRSAGASPSGKRLDPAAAPAEPAFPTGEALAALLARDPEAVRRRDSRRQTLLHRAAAQGDLPAVEALLARGASVRALADDGATPLHRAAAAGSDPVAFRLLTAGASASATDHRGRSPLFLARTPELAAALIAAGAPVDAPAAGKETPLLTAAARGDAGVVRTLLASGASHDARNYFGAAALHLAAREGHLETLRALLEGGADREARDGWHRTALHTAIWAGRLDAARLMLDAGIPVTSLSYGFSTPLHIAAEAGRTAIAALLIERGAEVNARTDFGRTPLHDAVHGGHAETVALLIERGAEVSVRNNRQVTPLHWAAAGGQTDIADLLLERGAEVNPLSNRGETPLALALRHRRMDVAERLRRAGGVAA